MGIRCAVQADDDDVDVVVEAVAAVAAVVVVDSTFWLKKNLSVTWRAFFFFFFFRFWLFGFSCLCYLYYFALCNVLHTYNNIFPRTRYTISGQAS